MSQSQAGLCNQLASCSIDPEKSTDPIVSTMTSSRRSRSLGEHQQQGAASHKTHFKASPGFKAEFRKTKSSTSRNLTHDLEAVTTFSQREGEVRQLAWHLAFMSHSEDTQIRRDACQRALKSWKSLKADTKLKPPTAVEADLLDRVILAQLKGLLKEDAGTRYKAIKAYEADYGPIPYHAKKIWDKTSLSSWFQKSATI